MASRKSNPMEILISHRSLDLQAIHLAYSRHAMRTRMRPTTVLNMGSPKRTREMRAILLACTGAPPVGLPQDLGGRFVRLGTLVHFCRTVGIAILQVFTGTRVIVHFAGETGTVSLRDMLRRTA